MTGAKDLKVAVLFHRLGPYHFARLRAAGQRLFIVAVESSGADETYAWDVVTGAEGFERVTLFENADAQKLPVAEVAGRVGTALDKIQPGVVVVPGWSDSAALGAVLWCWRNRIPAVVMSDSTTWDERRVSWKEWPKSQIVKMCSVALVAGTPHRDYLVQLGMQSERIFLGYDAVDNRYFADKAAEIGNRKSEIRNQNGLPEKYFLASARFVEKKNLPRLLQAYARYRQLASNSEFGIRNSEGTSSRPSPQNAEGVVPWNLVLLGDGPLRPALVSQIQGLGLHEHVQMPGFKQYPELPAYYGLASAFVHASTTEQWGLVVNEAMASGLPVLVSNRCGCARALVQEGVNGFTFDPCNVEQLAQLMVKISAFKVGRATPCAPISDSEPSSIIPHPSSMLAAMGSSSSPPRPGRGIEGEVSNPVSAPYQPSTINPQPSSTLAAMGTASRAIIADWGPERFAEGLKQAVETALKVGPQRASWLQRMILKAMLRN